MYEMISKCEKPVNVLLWIVLLYNFIKLVFVIHFAMNDAVNKLKAD